MTLFETRVTSKDDLDKIEKLIKSANVDLAWHMSNTALVPLPYFIYLLVKNSFIDFEDGWHEFERNGIHPFVRFTFDNTEFICFSSYDCGDCLARIGDKEFTIFEADENFIYDETNKQRIIKSFADILKKNKALFTGNDLPF